jgi:predicted Zn finger-like uncharacterized protein
MIASPARHALLDSLMLIVCPSCATSYEVGLASLGPHGRQVRCVRCASVWHAEPTPAEKLMAAAAALGPASRFAPGRAVDEESTYAYTEAASAPEGGRGADQFDATADLRYDETWHEAPAAQLEEAADQPFPSALLDPAEMMAPPIAPMEGADGDPQFDIDAEDFSAHRVAPKVDIESAAARRDKRAARRGQAQWPLSRWQSVILALALIDAILIGWRSDFVRALPQTASFYAMFGLPVNLRSLVFDGINTATEQHEGVPILVVEGNVVNASSKSVDVPRLKFIVRNAARQEIYAWTAVAARTVLPGGEAVAFRTRLASPPVEGRDVVVRFVNRRDIVAATH